MAETVSLAVLNTVEGRRNPYPFYAELHKRGPICRVNPGEGRYAFVIHGHGAVSQVLRDATFKVIDKEHSPPGSTDRPTQSIFMNSMMFNNEPAHMRMRRMFQQVFTARRVARLEPAIERIAGKLLDRMFVLGAHGAPLDFMAEFAYPLPSGVMGALIGVPEKDLDWYRPLAMALDVVLKLGGATAENARIADEASLALMAYFNKLAEQRRAEPQDDLLSGMVQAMEDGSEQLTEEELLANIVVLFNAGFVTTTHLLGKGLTLLLEHPDAVAQLCTHPELASSHVEELLRMEVPAQFVIRAASEDAEIAGMPIPKGSRVIILLAAANRDPSLFPDPDVFDPSRFDPSRPSQIMTFSTGSHFCLGAALSRVEGQIGINMLFDRFPRLALADEPIASASPMLHGYDTLSVRVR